MKILAILFTAISILGALTTINAQTVWSPEYKNSLNINKILSISGENELLITIKGETEQYYDFVTIYDANNKVVQKLDGKFEDSFRVKGDTVKVNFKTDGSVTRRGFKIEVSKSTPLEYTGKKAKFKTGKYTNNSSLTKRLKVKGATKNTRYEVKIKGETEKNYDFLILFNDKGEVLQKVSGKVNKTFQVTSKYIDVEFISDYSVTKNGIKVVIKELKALSGYPICDTSRYTAGDIMVWNSKEYLVVDNISIKTTSDYSSICTTQVTDMSFLFENRSEFNQDISNFDTSNVTDMRYMFMGASSFNQSVSNFNTSKVTDMSWMFNTTERFNQPLNNFDTSNVTNMDNMFQFTMSFNQALKDFNTSNVISMEYIFWGAEVFNQDCTSWEVSQFNWIKPEGFDRFSNVWQENFKPRFEIGAPDGTPCNDNNATTKDDMYTNGVCQGSLYPVCPANDYLVGDTIVWDNKEYYVADRAILNKIVISALADDYNASLPSMSGVCTTQITNMSELFGYERISYEAAFEKYGNPLNIDISNFDTSNVTDMSWMFAHSSMNQSLSNFDTSNVTDMSGMFYGSTMNQSLSSFDTSNVTDMSGMFVSSRFNQSLSSFDTSNVTDMSGMFSESIFNQSLSSFDTSNVTNMAYMFNSSIFNQSLSSFDTSSVTTMYCMFAGSVFNQPLSHFNTSNVTDMVNMFGESKVQVDVTSYVYRYTVFNQDISNWNVSQFNGIEPFQFDYRNDVWQEEFKPQFETIPAPRYIRANDMVTDTSTGLMWQDDVVVEKQWLTDANFATCSNDNGHSPACFNTSGDTATSYCSALTLGGYTDWSLPEIFELVNFGYGNIGSYWTSTSDSGIHFTNYESAWLVDSIMDVQSNSKNGTIGVRCVRNPEVVLVPHYTRANDIVTDTSTGLMWQDDVVVEKQWLTDANFATCNNNPMSSPACRDTSGDTASSYCSSLTLGDHTDWRLPDIHELASIRESNISNPAINTTYFNNVNSGSYWSNSFEDEEKHYAKFIDFSYGNFSESHKDDILYIRCVREAQ